MSRYFFIVQGCLLSFSNNILRTNLRSECETLLKTSCEKLGLHFGEVKRDEHGKPYILNQDFYFSFSHSQDVACCVVCKDHRVGVDIQYVSEKLRTVRPKFLSPNDFGNDEEGLENLCRLWCIKEAVFKASPYHLLSLKNIKIIDRNHAEDQNGLKYDLFCSTFQKLHFALAVNL